MKRLFLLPVMALLPTFSVAQSAPDPKPAIESLGASSWRYDWTGTAGWTYFIQWSEDLANWHYFPVIEHGADPDDFEFSTNADQFFMRLQFTDTVTSDPEGDDFDGDGMSNIFEVAHGLNPFLDDADVLFQGGPVTNLEAYQAGVQADPNATMQNFDGDDLANPLDADPKDPVIDWRAGATPSFAVVELDIEDADDLMLVDFTPRGTVWFRRLSDSTNVVVNRSLQLRYSPAEAKGEGEFGSNGDTIVGESIPGFRIQTGNSGERLWDPQSDTYTPWQGPTGYHDDLCDERDGLLLGTNWLIPYSPGIGVKRSPVGSPMPGDDSIGSFYARIEANRNVVSDLAYWRWNTQSGDYDSPDLLPGTSAVRSATLVQAPQGRQENKWNLVAAWSGGLMVSHNSGGFVPAAASGSLSGGIITGATRQGWAVDGVSHRIWANDRWTPIAELLGTPVPTEAALLDILDTGLAVARFRRPGEAWRVALLVPVEFVPDWNRDGMINGEDRGKVTRENPWRWWINDDNDGRDGESRGNNQWDIPGDPPPTPVYQNWWNNEVDGVRDLLDFFPLHLDLGMVLGILKEEEYRYLLKHEGEAFNFYEFHSCVPDGSEALGAPNAYLKKIGIAHSHAWNKELKLASVQGAELSSDMLQSAKDGKGVVVLEGRKQTTNPLVLEIVRKSDNRSMAEIEFPVETSGVEDMFRHVNLRDLTENPASGRVTKTTEPANYPDELTNGKYVAYIHGFNVDAQSARGSQSNIFKRLHQLGSKARYIGVTWNGTPENPGVISAVPDYHRAMDNGLTTGVQLQHRLAFAKGSDLTVIAHSLGNSVAGNAIAHFGLQASRYYIVNGAVPLEAYDSEQRTFTSSAVPNGGDDMARNMTDNAWHLYYDFGRTAGQTGDYDPQTGTSHGQARLLSRNWHRLFPVTDKRSELTWRGYFAEPQLLSIAYNFYSPGDEVVENATSSEAFDENTWRAITAGFNLARHSWINQEMAKGGRTTLEYPLFHDINGGWDFNYNQRSKYQGNDDPADLKGTYYEWEIVSQGWPTEMATRRYYPDEARDEITDEMLKTQPFHRPFLYSDLYDPAQGSVTANIIANKYKLLGTAIPASSFAIAANYVGKLDEYGIRNFDMQAELKHAALSWPAHPDTRTADAWAHSDFKDVCIQLVHPLYEKWINLGRLDEN